MKGKKRIWWRPLVFAVLFSIVFCVVSQMFITADRSDISNIRGFYYEPKNSLDVVTMGPSEMYTGYAPTLAWHEFGYTSYNFGAGAIPCNLYKSMLKEVLKRQNPKLIVVNISDYYDGEWNYDDEVYMRKWIDNIPWSQNKIDTIKDVIAKNDRAGYFYSLWKYHDNWANPLDVFNALKVKIYLAENGGTNNKGFLTNTTITGGQENLAALGKRDSLNMSFSKKTEGYLRDFLDFCKECNIENMLFIAMPHQMKSINADVIDQIGGIVGEYGYDFMNLDKSYAQIGIDDATDFSDGEHMNVNGMEKFTTYLGQYIVDNYDVARSDSGYTDDIKADWDACYEKTMGIIDRCKEDMKSGIHKEYWEGD